MGWEVGGFATLTVLEKRMSKVGFIQFVMGKQIPNKVCAEFRGITKMNLLQDVVSG